MNAACRPMLDKMADLVSGLLSADERDAVRSHINQCALCREYLDALEREDRRLGEFLGQLDAEISRAADDAVVAVRTAWASGAIKPIPWWRMVMESRTVKLTTSGAIAATLIVAAFVATKPATPAYAVEQTIEAMRKVQFVHVHGRDWEGRNVEAWMKIDPNTGMIDSYRLDEKDARRLTVTTPSHTYYYDRDADLVRSVGGTVAMTWVRWGRFFEDAVEWSRRLGGEVRTTQLCDPATGRGAIAIDLESDDVIVRAMIDGRTKLPTEVHIETLFGPIEGVPFQHIDRLEFPKRISDEVFQFDVPENATIVQDSHPFADRLLPVEVLDFAIDVHEHARERVGAPADVFVNTQLYIVDQQRRLARGGIQVVRNRTDKPRGGEIALGSFSPGNIRLFDRDGTQLPSHVLQYRLFQGGKYRLYCTLGEPIPPGESRYLFYAISGQHSLTRSASDAAYALHMDNHFGNEVVENFILVTPAELSVRSASEPLALQQDIAGCTVYVWQKWLPGAQTNQVDVVLYDAEPIETEASAAVEAGSTGDTAVHSLLPKVIVSYAMDVHTEASQRLGAPASAFVNTQLYVVDDQMTLRKGGVALVRNPTYRRPIVGEAVVGNFSHDAIDVFDDAGNQLETRVEQRKTASLGKYRLYCTLDRPLPPGQLRYLCYVIRGRRPLAADPSGGGVVVPLENHFGEEVVESFILVTPSDQSVQSASEPYAFSDALDSRKAFVWQKLNPPNQTNRVDVVLTPE